MSKIQLVKQLDRVTDRRPWVTTPTEVVNLYGYSKRSPRIVNEINTLLENKGLIMEPDFDNTYCYSAVIVKLKKEEKGPDTEEKIEEPIVHDPVPRLSRLKSANLYDTHSGTSKLVSVNRETTIKEAVTLMMQNNYSQLPIVANKGRKLEGIVSWRSIGKAISMNRNVQRVFDCREDLEPVKLDLPLLEVMDRVQRDEVVVVKNKEEIICGIVTASDIAEEFKKHAEAFFLIEQIEKQIRHLLKDCKIGDILACLDVEKLDKEVNDIYDLSFGHYVLALERDDFFEKLNLGIEKSVFVKGLHDVRLIRNDVMHFSPDPMCLEDVEKLVNFAKFLMDVNR